MKKFTIRNRIENEDSMIEIFIGEPNIDFRPLHFQEWYWAFKKEKNIPEIITFLTKESFKLANKYNLHLKDVCSYAFSIDRKAKYRRDILDELEHIISSSKIRKNNLEIIQGNIKAGRKVIEIPEFNFTIRTNHKYLIGDLEELSTKIVLKKSMVGDCSRELFVGIMLCLISIELEKELIEIYETLKDPHNFIYRLCIILDCHGDKIHQTGFKYLKDFIFVNHSLHIATIDLLRTSMEDFLPNLEDDTFHIYEYDNNHTIEEDNDPKLLFDRR